VPCAALARPGVASYVRASSCFRSSENLSGAARTPRHFPTGVPPWSTTTFCAASGYAQDAGLNVGLTADGVIRAGICLRTRRQFPRYQGQHFSDSLMDEAIGR
jgi:hypothetical protein